MYNTDRSMYRGEISHFFMTKRYQRKKKTKNVEIMSGT